MHVIHQNNYVIHTRSVRISHELIFPKIFKYSMIFQAKPDDDDVITMTRD